MVRKERAKGLESRIDALHSPSLVAVGDLTADAFVLLLLTVGRKLRKNIDSLVKITTKNKLLKCQFVLLWLGKWYH